MTGQFAMRQCVFSVDVEDWFHIMDLPNGPKIQDWDRLPSLVAKNFMAILDLLAESDIKATCFFLGWVAEKHPRLVHEAVARGHEIASHGYANELIYEVSRERFGSDVAKAKKIIEDIAGARVLGYRAPGFSVTDATPWFFDEVAKAGYVYSSSVFPARRGHGGRKGFDRRPQYYDGVLEFPITVAEVRGFRVCLFGGGYLRLFPYPLIRAMSTKVLLEDLPVIYYIHPREIDPAHPRLAMSTVRAFKSYVGLSSVRNKVRSLFADFSFTTFSRLYEERCRHSSMAMLGNPLLQTASGMSVHKF